MNHAHQYPDHRLGSSDALAAFLFGQVEKHGIDLLAEEMSVEALRREGCHQSTVQVVARRTNIAHVFLDPDSAERSALGIPSYDEIKARRGLGKYVFEDDAAKLKVAEREHWGTREAEWVRRLDAAQFARALAVVGSKHVESLSATLHLRNHAVTILTAKWEA